MLFLRLLYILLVSARVCFIFSTPPRTHKIKAGSLSLALQGRKEHAHKKPGASTSEVLGAAGEHFCVLCV
jgi:hypothetical protein